MVWSHALRSVRLFSLGAWASGSVRFKEYIEGGDGDWETVAFILFAALFKCYFDFSRLIASGS